MMDNNHKAFRDHFEGRPEPPFDDGHWLALEKRLDDYDKRRSFGWWMLLPALLLSLGANAWLWQYNPQWHSLEIRRDTVVVTRVLYHTDTVFSSRVIERQTVVYLTAPIGFQPFTTHSQPRLGGAADVSLQGLDSADGPTIPESCFVSPAPLLPLAEPEWMICEVPRFSPVREATNGPEDKKRWSLQEIIEPLRPRYFAFNAGCGRAYSLKPQVDNSPGFIAGAEGIIGLSPRLQLWAGADYVHTSYETRVLGADVPSVNPPSTSFTFINAEVEQPSWQFGLGLLYRFAPEKRFSPYLGVGFTGASLLPYEVTYAFRDEAMGIQFETDQVVDPPNGPTGFLALRAGGEYRLSSAWAGLLHMQYRTVGAGRESGPPEMISVKIGLKYRLQKKAARTQRD